MKRSTERMITTHVGSLPRPQDLMDMMAAKKEGKGFDDQRYNARVREAVAEIVRKQVELGIDIVDDGELGKPSFVTYVHERLGGIEPGGLRGSPWGNSREVRAFPEFYKKDEQSGVNPAQQAREMLCTSPVVYKGHAAVKQDIDILKAACAAASVEETFMPSISPAMIEDWHKNRYYKTDEEFLFAIADAMHEEYKAIVDAGILVQIDDPRISTYHLMNPDKTLEESRKWAEVRVEALNHALRGLPEDRIRFHTCYSINMGPRVYDMELKDIVDIMLKVRAGGYSFEAANPRHEHEWRVWERVKLPEGKVLIPGFITQSTILVEHPELVAQRIVRFAKLVGRENVIAGADCGFATFAGSLEIHPSIVWAKFQALSDGAKIATKELWGR